MGSGTISPMESFQIHQVMELLRKEYLTWNAPAITVAAECGSNPFRILISCIISLRTKDEVTAMASTRLFSRADTPEKIQKLTVNELEGLIYPAGFYRTKAKQIKEICRRLIAEFDGKVPGTIEALLEFKGVGRKTANLVVTLGFGKPGICVDTHVHRICNRWGYVTTLSPHATEEILRVQLPPEYWIQINELLVAFGQNHCTPLFPRCTTCKIRDYCSRIGVTKYR